MKIERYDSVPGMSRAVVHNGIIYFTGHSARPEFITPEEQTRAVLERLEGLLTQFGSDKEHVLSALIFVRDIACYDQVAAIWREWIPAAHAPASTLVEGKPSQDYLHIEITLTAAVKDTP